MKIIKLPLSTFFLLTIAICSFSQNRSSINLSGPGWRLWKDSDTTWKNDELFLPPVDISKLPIHEPTGGWQSLSEQGSVAVKVPGTAEEYLQKISGPDGDIKGVSWWYRDIAIPAGDAKKKTLLRFESARYRSEVFINEKLAGYDLIGNTPFEVDISNFVKPGETAKLAVRITDPGGNFDWGDGDNIAWGKVNVTGSHGFGGITGRVQLIMCSPLYVDDIYMQNTPEPHTANAIVTLQNQTGKSTKVSVLVRVLDKKDPKTEIFRTKLENVNLPSGKSTFTIKLPVPKSKLWDVDNPNLYVSEVSLVNGVKTVDVDKKVFGFRWFELAGIGKDAMFRLNGKRIVLRTAISWGFWPVNGIFPTPELAEKQVKLAKELGLNMLNFHRCIGSPIVLEYADELGLLYYEEPGNYLAGTKDAFSRKCLREKLLRMVRRDRSHPSMIIYNMQNEMRDVDSAMFLSQRSDMRAAHLIDPSRTITRTSGWALAADTNDQAKLHSRPFDTTQYLHGWYDYHRAPGPHTWFQALYKNPKNYYGYTTNKKEIVYWGEEGALSTPSRLAKIKQSIDQNPNIGWDGAMYLDNYNDFETFLQKKKLKEVFPNVDELTKAMGTISLEHQGRKIENIRIGNTSDGYAINGWESEILENHSGIVDCYRNPKADPIVLSYYNQPLYVAVKPRQQVIDLPGSVTVDFYIINEKNLKGEYNLQIVATDHEDKPVFTKQAKVVLKGGDVYGQLLLDSVVIPLSQAEGKFQISATLVDKANKPFAKGKDEVVGVDWRRQPTNRNGGIWEYGENIKTFLKTEKNKDVLSYYPGMDTPDWIAVAHSPNGGDFIQVPNAQYRDKSGKEKGVTATYFVGPNFEKQVAQQIDKDINLIVYQGATPHPSVPTTFNYSIKWEGQIVPPYTGTYGFQMEVAYGGDGKLEIDGKTFEFDKKLKMIKGELQLEAGKPVTLLATLQHRRHSGACRLFWSIPEPAPIDPQGIINRVKNEGATLILLDHAETWMELIEKNTNIKYKGKFAVGSNWLGGVEFVKQHPLFKGLPTNQGMNWPYEAVVKNGNARLGLEMDGEELVAGAYHCFPQKLGTSVGVIKCGKGKIIFSTLEIYNNLLSTESTSAVAKKLLCNFIDFAGVRE